ncbi:MAG TPA: hypothetical protein DCX94_15310 [Alteromonas macleodii]|jgi:hypothetical protein|nr:hypothetical protein [Alteromonas macleodii]|tara:strand:+ start:672 stop:1181 length:510 start_codon:yes stop_codon:yes gene_type:complete
MANFTGATGKLFLNNTTDNSDPGTEIAKVQNWSISSSVSLVSTKTLGQTDDVFTPVGRSTTGSCRILYYQENLGTKNSNDSASTFLNKVLKQRNSATDIPTGASLDQNDTTAATKTFRIRLTIDDGTTNGKFVDMRVFITNVSLSMSVGDVVAADIQFQSQGAPVVVDI